MGSVGDIFLNNFALSMSSILQEAKRCLLAMQNRPKFYANIKRCEISFVVGFHLLLNTFNINSKTPRAKKLLPKCIGPL
jgi:hypothetical protein